ncbi:Sorting nexin-13 [Toxocara canis]|uniref:Sorting nexin-13 n=1 Tax=Toxocara canis TaxID=6265 RepID=A0A0B2W345_TOXCA|nr:Sorting nexin-13 [Toxocara canis]
MPSEDFRSRPLRFLVREITVRRIILPVLDMFSDPDYINHIIVWLLSEVQLRSEDFITTLETSKDVQELEAVLESLCDEAAALRAKDTGGEQGAQANIFISTNSFQFSSYISWTPFNSPLPSSSTMDDEALVQLPIHVVLTNSVGVAYFTDFLASIGSQNLIDCYLAIEVR